MTARSGSIDIQLVAEDYVSAVELSAPVVRSLATVALGAIVLLLLLLYLAMSRIPGETQASAAWTLVGYLGVMAALFATRRYVLLPRGARRVFRQQKAMQWPRVFSWNEDGVTSESTRGRWANEWTDFLKWRENERLFLLYTSDAAFVMVPKRAFSDAEQVADFGRLVREKIGPRPGVRRKAGAAEAFT